MLERRRRWFWTFWICMFVAAFAGLCLCGYSDGDDAYFYEYVHSMGFLEYLGWRYDTWVGRMAAEALVYITFRLGLWFWRPMNALMLVLLPLGVISLAAKMARGYGMELPARLDEYEIGAAILAVCGYFLMTIYTVGYAAVWVNGSVFYTWSFTCGIWALAVVADIVLVQTKMKADQAEGIRISMEGCGWKPFCVTIPCAVIASMSIEQIGAVLLTFEVLAVLYGLLVHRRLHPLLLLQTLVTAGSFLVLFTAPGNSLRMAEEIETWMPFFDTMSFGEHVFITLHWLISSFANENRLFLCGIWVAGGLLLLQRNRQIVDWILLAAACVFIVVALLPFAGVTVFSDMGIQYVSGFRVERMITWGDLSDKMRFALIWWGISLIFTLLFLWRASEGRVTLILVYLAGIASEAILFFSPTMYASGARIYYLTDILYLLIILVLIFLLEEKKKRYAAYGMLAVLGAVNVVCTYPAWEYLVLLV